MGKFDGMMQENRRAGTGTTVSAPASSGNSGSGGGEGGASGGKSGAGQGTSGGGESGSGGGGSAGVQNGETDGKSRVPADIPKGSGDDIVARQLREMAKSEKDPILREKLWNEYRRYKGIKVPTKKGKDI